MTINQVAPVEGLQVDLTDGVLRITLDRPDSLNSVTAPMLFALADLLERAATDVQVRVVRLGGSGRGFCSGASIGADSSPDAHDPMQTLHGVNRVARAIVALPFPAVAVVHGPAAGVGVSLALACDLVLASEDAFFMLAFTKIGLMPDGGATALVTACIGRPRAMRMAMLAERISATEALRWGLVSAVYPANEFSAEAEQVIMTLKNGPARSLALTKQAINDAALTQLDMALDRETVGQSVLLVSDDFAEGRRAFQERRPPVFTSWPKDLSS